MNVTHKKEHWSHEPWTVQRIVDYFNTTTTVWYAFNTHTGERKPERSSYDEAFKDIPEHKYAKPWGV
jgi:hypothetical protein